MVSCKKQRSGVSNIWRIPRMSSASASWSWNYALHPTTGFEINELLNQSIKAKICVLFAVFPLVSHWFDRVMANSNSVCMINVEMFENKISHSDSCNRHFFTFVSLDSLDGFFSVFSPLFESLKHLPLTQIWISFVN